MKTAAVYARVASDKQSQENAIACQPAALVAFARAQQFEVPKEWIFEDDGYSGANLIRPGLERVRDLAAEGLIQAVLIYAPDRLSRRYAHQILLIEELARAGVETLFVCAPRGSTPEDELLVQFQGMIAVYERAQILERSPGRSQRTERRSVRISFYPQDRSLGRVLPDRRRAGSRCTVDVRTIHRSGAQHRRHRSPLERTGNPHLQATRSVGAFDGLGHAAKSGLQRPSLLW